MNFPTEEEFAKSVAEKAISEIEVNGRTIKQWIEILCDVYAVVDSYDIDFHRDIGDLTDFEMDIINALKEAGIKISTFQYVFNDKNIDEFFLSSFIKLLKDTTYDAVFSINYYPLLAEGCYQTNTKYISWSYDCPLDVRNIEDTLGFSTNYVFLFDKLQVCKYTDMGFENIYHLPLAVNTVNNDRLEHTARRFSA